MSILHADSFAIYGTNEANLVEGVYAEYDNLNLTTDPDGVSTQNVLGFQTSLAGLLRYALTTATDVFGCSQRFWCATLPANDSQRPYIISYRDASNTQYGYVTIDTTGRISFYFRQSGESTPSLIATTGSPVVTAEGWWHIECKIDLTTPRFTLKVEGTTVIDENATWTVNAGISNIYQVQHTHNVSAGNFGITTYMKDLVYWDDAGSVNNDFLGKVAVYVCRPDGDDTSAWTESTGSVAWSLLDNSPPDDATYISAASALTEILNMSALPTTVSAVKAVTTWVRQAKDDAGDATCQVSIKSGTALDNGADNELTIAQIWWRDVSELDPNTASAWTRTTVDASKLQIARTT